MKEEFINQVEENKRIIFKVCRMYCNTPDDVQDLFQDIVFQLWKSYPSFKNESKISTWIYRVALNTAITQLRKDKNRPSQRAIDNDILQLPEDESDRWNENFDLMMSAIDKLSKVEKAVVVLYMDDFSYHEMAEIMGISESNIGFKINQIKGKLKKIVNILAYGT